MTVDFVKLFSERTVWKISPWYKGVDWKDFKEDGFIGLGDPPPYDELEDLRIYRSKQEFPEDMGPKRRSYYWDFAKEMNRGDIVIAVSGGKIFGAGEVVSDYVYEEDLEYCHRRRVHWFPIPEISNKYGKVCKAVYRRIPALVRINKTPELIECGKNLNDFILDISDQTVYDVLNDEVQSSIDLDFLEDLSEDILTSKSPETIERIVWRFQRDQRVVDALKTLYAGQCQFQKCTKMIEMETGWYTEAHHLIPLGKRGSDHPTNFVNLCPLHHKMLHHAKNREELAKPNNVWYHNKHKNLF